MGINKLDLQVERRHERNVFKLFFVFFLCVELCYVDLFDNRYIPHRYDKPHYSFGYNIQSNNIMWIYSFKG